MSTSDPNEPNNATKPSPPVSDSLGCLMALVFFLFGVWYCGFASPPDPNSDDPPSYFIYQF